ncbi:hypothetical protein GCM10028800_06380 [Nesterenkonia populi]
MFVDNDVCAFDGRQRPGYQALVNTVRHGVTHIVVWHVDRLYRRPRELEDTGSMSTAGVTPAGDLTT